MSQHPAQRPSGMHRAAAGVSGGGSGPRRPGDRPLSGRHARSGFFSTTAALAFALVLTGCGGPGTHEDVVGTSTPAPAVTAVETSIFQLSPGQCFDRPAEDGLYSVAVVPCQVAHDLEMYGLFQLDEPSWPGPERVDELAREGCREQFVSFTGSDPAHSELGYTMYTPSEGSWSEGDRQVLCALQLDNGGRLIGTQRGTAHTGR